MPIKTLAELADAIETRFGPECALVGKAVTLVDMLAAEFLVVFHETASGYTTLTQAFNAGLREAGCAPALYPLVRLLTRRGTRWPLPAAALRLPAHLAQAFGQDTLPAPEFAARWRGVVEDQRRRLRESRAPRKLRDLLRFLDAQGSGCWCDRLEEYEAAQKVLQRDRRPERRPGGPGRGTSPPIGTVAGGAAGAGNAPGRGLAGARSAAAGAHPAGERRARTRHACSGTWTGRWRSGRRRLTCRWRRRGSGSRRRGCSSRSSGGSVGDWSAARRRGRRGRGSRRSRREAHLARLHLVRDAYLTVEGLEHTNYRPTAWWLPLVTPGGEWLSAMAAGTQARLEPL